MRCSLVNKETGEPKVFYRTDNGQEFTTLREGLNNSSKYYSVGVYKNDEEFSEIMRVPKFKQESVEGKIQTFIADGRLGTKSVDNKQTYEILGETDIERRGNKDDIILALDASIGRNNYTVKGRNIVLESKVELPSLNDINSLVDNYGEYSSVRMLASNYLTKKDSSEKIPTNMTKAQLKSNLLGLLEKMGFSTSSLEDYNERFVARNGYAPDAQALVDTINKVVAFKNGEIILEDLTEEVAHLIIEGWNQQEVDNLLELVPNLSLYSKYKNEYTEIYSNKYPNKSEQQIETLVRKEILGKFLAQQLQNPTSSEVYAEQSIINKMFTLLSNFIRDLFISSEINNDLKTFTDEVRAHIANDTIAEQLDLSNSEGVVMFSTGSSSSKSQVVSQLTKIKAQLNKIQISTTSVPENLSKEEDLTILGAAFETLETINREAESLASILKSKSDNNQEVSGAEQAKAATLTGDLNTLVPRISAAVSKLENITKEQKNAFNKLAEKTNANIFNVSQSMALENSQDVTKIVDRIGRALNIGKDHARRGWLEDQVEKIQKDHSSIFNFFAPLMLSNNIYVRAIGALTDKMFQTIEILNSEAFNRHITKLHKVDLDGLSKDNHIISPVDHSEFNKDRRKLEYEVMSSINEKLLLDDAGNIITEEEFINSEKTPITVPTVTEQNTIKFLMFFKRVEMDDMFGPLEDYEKRQLEEFEAVGINDKNYKDLKGGLAFLNDYYSIKDAKSRIRRTYSMSDPIFKEESNLLSRKQKELRDPFEHKKIKEFNTEEQLLSYLVKTGLKVTRKEGPNTVKFQQKTGEAPYYIELTDPNNVDAAKTFLHLKLKNFNAEKAKDSNNNLSQLTSNFISSYRKYEESLKKDPNIDNNDIDKMMRNWVFVNGNLAFTDEFFDALQSNEDYDVNDLPVPVRDRASVLINNIKGLNRHKRSILSSGSHFRSFNEYDPSLFSEEDKEALENINERINNYRRELRGIYTDNEVDLPIKKNISRNTPNQAFITAFQNKIGKPYSEATFDEIEKFFHDSIQIPRSSKSKYDMMKLGYERGNISQAQKDYYLNLLEDRGYALDLDNKESVLIALIEESLPDYYKRFEPKTNESYNNYINNINKGLISTEQLIYDIENNNLPQFVQFNVSSTFNNYDSSKKTIEELSQEFLQSSDKSRKLDLINEILELYPIGNKYKNSNFLNQIKGREDAYLTILDMNIETKINFDSLSPRSIFELTYHRKSGLKRFTKILKGSKSLSQISDEFKESISFRPDEYEDAYKAGLKVNAIPKIGLHRLSPVERSDDLVEVLFRGLSESYTYQQRVYNFKEVNAILETAKGNMEDGAKAIEATQEYIAQHYFGRKSLMHMRVNIGGREVDFSKIMMKGKNFFAMMGIGASPIVALTAFTTSKFQEYLTYTGGRDIYRPAHDRARMEHLKLLGGSFRDIGSILGDSKAEQMMRWAGVHSTEDRYMNADFNGVMRNMTLPKIMYAPMTMAMTPVELKLAMSVMMEYREVDGQFIDFPSYIEKEKIINNSTKTREELQKDFEKLSDKSLYDKFLETKPEDYDKIVPNKKRAEVMSKIAELNRKVLAQAPRAGKVLAQSHPLLGYMFTYRNWLSVAAMWTFDGMGRKISPENIQDGVRYERYYNDKTHRDDIGRFTALIEYLGNVRLGLKSKGTAAFLEAWKSTDDAGRQALKESLMAQGVITTLILITGLLGMYADDDDNEDNYPLQLLTYLSFRTLNESFSAAGPFGLGVANEFLAAAQNPIVISGNVVNMVGLTDVSKMGDVVKSGPYKGWNKYAADMFKITALRNLYTVSDASIIGQTRKSYTFYNVKDSSFSAIPLAKAIEESDKEEE